MHLVSILDLEENEAVLQIVRNNNVSFTHSQGGNLAISAILSLCSFFDNKKRWNKRNIKMFHHQVSNVWIGLTREVPEPMGTWRWTLPGDASFTFSNWDHGLSLML